MKKSELFAVIGNGPESTKLKAVFTLILGDREKITLKELRKNPLYIKSVNFSGNLKLVNTKTTRFVIWNIPSKKTCPFATVECINNCYACASEKNYPDVLPCREKNLLLTKDEFFTFRMIYTLTVELCGLLKGKKRVIFRIHESGDFYSKEYFQKWLSVAEYFNTFDNAIKFVAYTKSVPFTVGTELPGNLVIRASIWADTKPELEKISRDNYPIYTAYTESEINAIKEKYHVFEYGEIDGFTGAAEKYFCRCSDCANCGACFNNSIKEIFCVIH